MKSDFTRSGTEILNKKNYILVKPPKGINFWDILMIIGKIIPMPEFKDKNDIWLFRDGSLRLNFSDLQKLKDFGRENYPKTAKVKKTAVVVSTGFQRGLADSYISTG